MRENDPETLPAPGPAWRVAYYDGAVCHTLTQSWFVARELTATALGVPVTVAARLMIEYPERSEVESA